MTKIKQMLCALLTVCLLLIGSANAMAAQLIHRASVSAPMQPLR